MSFWYRNDVCSNNEQSQKQKKSGLRVYAGGLSALCVVGVAAYAQDVVPGVVASFDVTQRLEYSDNPDFEVDGDSDFFGRTVLGFGLESVTKVERFSLNLGTEIEEFRDNQDSFDVTNSSLRLGYLRNTRNALLDFSLRYAEADTSSGIDDQDFDQDGNVINQDDGTRVSYGFTLGAAVGQEAPIGASFNWLYNEITYKDTDDPDLTDSSLNDFSGQIDFRIDPRIVASLTGKYIDFDASGPDGVDRETRGLGGALRLDVTPTLTADLGLSYDRIERSGGEVGTNDGISGNIGLLRRLPNGTLGLDYSSDVSSNDDGRRSFLSVSRDMALPRGALSVSLGVTGADTVGTDPLVQVDYRHDLPAGQISLGLSQQVTTDADNNEEINTALRAGYNQQINNLSSFGVNLAFFDRNELGDNPNDGQRIDLSLTYRYDLTRDWGLVSGFSHAYSTEDVGRDRRANTIFVGLQRSFNWSP